MYLFIITQPAPGSTLQAPSFFAIADARARTIRVSAETPAAAAQLCALRYFFGNGHTPDTARKIILTETCKGQYMARLATPNDLPKNINLQPPPTRTI